MNEYFETLGIEETASLEEIEASYVRCLKMYHPDTYVGDKSHAEQMTRKVIHAYRSIVSKKLLEEDGLKTKDKSTSASTGLKKEKKKWRKGTVYIVAIALLMGLIGSIIRLQGYSGPTETNLSESKIFSEKIMLEGISAIKYVAIKDHPESYSIDGKNDVRWRLELSQRAAKPKTWGHVFALKNETSSSAVACLNPVDGLQLTVSASLLMMREGEDAEKLENGCFRLMQKSEANILIEIDKKISYFSLEIGQNLVPINNFLPNLRNQFYRLTPENVTDVPQQSERLTVDEAIMAKDGPIEEEAFGDPIVRPLRPKEPAAATKPLQPPYNLLMRTSRQVASVSQRAALLLGAHDDPQRVKTFVGNVVWRLDQVSRGPGQPLSVGVRAEIDLPDAKLKAVMLFQQNTDEKLPASHTIELRFTPADGSVVPEIAQIQTPQLRSEDTPSGDPLVGVPTPILRNFFLVGLARGGPAEKRNIELIRNRGWFDVPMLLTDKSIAKITFEKGASGERVIKEAFDAWSEDNKVFATFAIVFATTSSKDEAEAAMKRLMQGFNSELKTYPPSIETAASTHSNTLYHVLVKPLRREEANTLCSAIKAKGGACNIRDIESLVSTVAKPIFAEPKKVRPVAVRPDGTIIDPNAPLPLSKATAGAAASNPDESKSKTDPTEITRLLSFEMGKQSSAPDLTVNIRPSLVDANSNVPRMSTSFWEELDASLHEQYKNCWNFKGASSTQRYIPMVKVEYSKDGSLVGQPALLNAPQDPSLNVLAESALRAVRLCNPIKVPKKFSSFYDQWKIRVLRFDPIKK